MQLIVCREYVDMKEDIEGVGVVWGGSSTVNDHLLIAPHPHCFYMNVSVS